MKKIKPLILLILSTALFSGCFLAPPTAVEEDEDKPDFVLSANIWKTTDGGKTWEVKNIGEGKANTKNIEVLSFAINPQDSRNIYAGLRSGGILETTNAGETWRFINYISTRVYGLAVSPAEGETLYASGVWQGRGKMFRTNDRGENWEEIFTSPSDGPLIISLVYDKRNPNVIYATSSDYQAFKSTDGGTSWQNMFVADSMILKIELDASDSKKIYLLSESGDFHRSVDGGANFEDMDNKINAALSSFGGNQFTVLVADPRVSNRVYLAGSGGLIVSDDAGEKWRRIDILNDARSFPIRTLAVSPRDSDEMIYGASQAAYKSTDGGRNWVTSQFEKRINILKYDPEDPDVIYAGFINN